MTEQKSLSPWEELGSQFISRYYQCFDQKDQRHEVGVLYHPTESKLTFEGAQIMGRPEIMKKLTTIPLDNVLRSPTTIDYQPTSEGGVLIMVLGQLRNTSENDKVMPFSQTFLIKPLDNSWFIFHDIFRLAIHNFSA